MAERAKNSMLKRMLEKFKSQFMPEKSGQLKITLDGTVVLVQRVGENVSYVGVDAEGTVVTYEPEFILDFPVYLINRPFAQIKVDDVILVREGVNAMYGKVQKTTKDSLTVLCFDGTVATLNKTRDFLTKNETVTVVIDMFGSVFKNVGGFNPGMFLLMNKENGGGFDFETLMMMNMMNGNNSTGGTNANFMGLDNNMMMLMLLGNKDGGGKFDFETLMMMNMMNNGGFNLFGTPVATPVAPKAKGTTKPKGNTKGTETVVEGTETE